MLDSELLQRYAQESCQRSFHELVARHGRFVFAAAMRKLRDRGLAEEVTQNVFTALARKAHKLKDCRSLSGWLYRAAQLESAMTVRRERRRRLREEKAAKQAHVTSTMNDEPDHALGMALDDALQSLNAHDRDTILARYYDGLTIRELAASHDIGEKAAQKRVERATHRLRRSLLAAGLTLSASGVQAGLMHDADSITDTQLVNLSQRSLRAATVAKASMLGWLHLPSLGVGIAALTITAWIYAKPEPTTVTESPPHTVSVLPSSVALQWRIDDLEVIYQLPFAERETALDKLMTHLESRTDVVYLKPLFERWSKLDPARAVTSATLLSNRNDYHYSLFIQDIVLAWFHHAPSQAQDWVETYDQERVRYESEFGDALLDSAMAWLVDEDVEKAIHWMLDRRIVTENCYQHIAERLLDYPHQELFELLDRIPDQNPTNVAFEIEHDAGEVNFGHLMPAAYGERKQEAGHLVYELAETTRKDYLARNVLKNAVASAPASQLAERSVALFHPKERGSLINAAIQRWTREDPNGPVPWLETLEAGPAKDAALKGFVSSVWTLDQESAHLWSDQMSNRAQKEALLEKLTLSTLQQH